MNLDSLLQGELAKLEEADLRRTLRVTDAGMLNFAANDYLGLSLHPALIEAARRAAADRGTGAGASRLVTGTSSAVLALEERLAAWKEKDAALVFSSGYAAALGTIPALAGKGDTVVLDKLAHASLIDAARLSGATVRTFPHNDMGRLDALLAKISRAKTRVLVVTESIFSMDGDAAPLRELVEIKDRHGAWLLVDEAHATGLYGATGAGLVAEAGLSARVEIVMGTLSKALGSVGGFIAGSRALIDWLVNRARSFVYSTALPPGVIAAGCAAVELCQTHEGAALRGRLWENVARFHAGLPARWKRGTLSKSAIQPLICGEAAAALELAATLRKAGFLIPAIRHPTVPRHAARLRVTLSAGHGGKEIDALNGALATRLRSK
ncbi:MAG TPA: 8-amino-7-oxononanoate synthase [Candidatus Methylacidiphilales bacterium]|jgi:8-amino-7-oxononanoate synthase|nr:8-amino-7-oxononanoate synthase [Candidatus Methylacidiphilales bacterium]